MSSDSVPARPSSPDPLAFLSGGGEMGARMRGFDWSSTPLGPAAQWPQSLKTCVRVVLTSRQPMFVWWGDALINLYNDAYRSIVGGKHPAALGQPAAEVWREIWHQIAPRADSCMRGDEGTYDEALLLVMERNGYPEETYYTFSYSPVPNDQGGTGGLFCANSDDTARIVGQRQLALLRDLAARTADARTWEEACELCARSLETDPCDLPFALLYVHDPARDVVDLAGAAGVARDHRAAPPAVRLDEPGAWPFAEVLRTREAVLVTDLAARFGPLPCGQWPLPPTLAVALPVTPSGQTGRAGVLVVGLSPYRRFDDAYRGFLELVAAQVAASIANAQAYDAERRRAEGLAALDQAKTAFFSNVSHEFRTPLTLMLGPLEDAVSSPEKALAGEDLATAYRNALRLLKLVNTLLDFSRAEAGRVNARYEPVDLATHTREIAGLFRAAVERGGLRYTVRDEALREPVYVDLEMWEKVVLNLLSNAFKFTLEGEIEVSLHDRGDRAELVVRDTGIGVAPGDLPRLFERFHRVEGAQGRTHEGSGIGLALVQELVRLHGGAIRAESAVGVGTTVRVEVPFGRGHLPDERVVAPRRGVVATSRAAAYVDEAMRWLDGADAGPTAATSRARVLVADDNADMRDYVSRFLRAHWDVRVVSDGALALAAAQREPFDLVVTDVMMPVLDGFGLLRALRADPRTHGLPVIMLSARAGDEARVEGLEAGADDYLVKPFSARELIARVRTHIALARARADAVSASRAKDEFLAMLGHELRNPLAPIVTALQLLRRRAAAPAQTEIAVIERQVQHLVRLVDDLLDVSRVTRGRLELKREPVELSVALDDAIQVASPLLEKSRHHLRVDVPAAGLAVYADAVRLAQVMSNLLTNAAKYTAPGGHIDVDARREGDRVVLRVRDDGIGISAEMLPRVFDLFSQEGQAIDRSQGGLGLGLAIVRRLVELHGGTASAHSEGHGRGSEFVVTLPAWEGDAPVADVAGRRRADTPVTGMRVLVVDDNEDASEMLRAWLELEGHEVRTAHDGLTALDVAEHSRPEAVLLDIGLPAMDGYEVARQLRLRESLKDALIIAVTGYGQSVDRARSSEAGFDLHAVKPVDLDMLGRVLAEHRRGARAR